jgi:Uma2 family endonuclease
MNVLLQREYTPDDLLQMGHGPRYELVNGRLVEKAMGQESDAVGINLITRLTAYSEGFAKGRTFGPNASYQIFPHDPRRVRYPDVSFIRRERMPPTGPARGHCRVVPDLAVEVVSPNDTAEEIRERVADYLRVGTQMVWVIYPNVRAVDVYRADGSGGWRAEGQELDGGEVLPGFVCAVADLFAGIGPPPPEGAGGAEKD